jgi:hypothetical protein
MISKILLILINFPQTFILSTPYDQLKKKQSLGKIKKGGSLATLVLDFRPITLRPILSNSLPFSTLLFKFFYLYFSIFLLKEKEVGRLAILTVSCLRPSPLRPILSNSLPFSTSNNKY